MVIDCHAHLEPHTNDQWAEKDLKLIESADRLGIDRLCCSIPLVRRASPPELFRECNQWVHDAMRRFPERIIGFCYVNPGYQREALDEIKRCVEERGFRGIKLYNEYRCNEPVVFPIVELAIRLRIPILQHAGHPHYSVKEQPRLSDGGMLAELARRYPEATLICGHICGGGDWEWTIKALRNSPNIYLDTSGSVTDDGTIEMAVEVVSAERVVFGCDMSMTAGMGKIRSARLSDEEKKKIFGENMLKLLNKRGSLG